MNSPKGIFKSAKSIVAEGQAKKAKLQFTSSNNFIQHHSQIHPATQELQEISLPNPNKNKKSILLKTATSREGKESSSNIKSRSCLKKEHSRCDEEEEIRSGKSIKFKTNLDKVFEYHMPGSQTRQMGKKSIHRRQKEQQECCYIY